MALEVARRASRWWLARRSSVESLMRLRRVDVGFETRNLLTFDVALVGERAEYQAKQVAFFEDMFRAIRALPERHKSPAAR